MAFSTKKFLWNISVIGQLLEDSDGTEYFFRLFIAAAAAAEDKLTSCLFLGIDICRTMEEIILLPWGHTWPMTSQLAAQLVISKTANPTKFWRLFSEDL